MVFNANPVTTQNIDTMLIRNKMVFIRDSFGPYFVCITARCKASNVYFLL